MRTSIGEESIGDVTNIWFRTGKTGSDGKGERTMRAMKAVAAVAMLLLALPGAGRAETVIVSCSGAKWNPVAQTQCSATFPAPVHTIDLRPTPGAAFAGTLDVRVTNGTVTHNLRTTWATGRIQTDGLERLVVSVGPPGSVWTLVVVASPAGTIAAGQFGGVVEA